MTLDEAWKEAEAALPTDREWMFEVVRSGIVAGDKNPTTGGTVKWPTKPYIAEAGPAWPTYDDPSLRVDGDTPIAALEALTAKLRGLTLTGHLQEDAGRDRELVAEWDATLPDLPR